jgi:putative ABC transport system permease protein
MKDHGVSAEAHSEVAFLRQAYGRITTVLYGVAYVVGGLIVVTLLLGILNTLLITVRKRSMELATLRALGFPRGALIASLIAETALCGLGGGLLGWLAVKALFGRAQLSVFSGVSVSQLTFDLHIGGVMIAVALACAIVIAVVVGGIASIQIFSATAASALRRV